MAGMRFLDYNAIQRSN